VTADTRYRCVAKPNSGYGRYAIHQDIYITEAEAAVKTVMDVTPPIRTANGWDPTIVWKYSDEALAAKPSDPSLWPEYADVFTTPSFQEGRNPHQQTTQTELENFIAGLDTDDDNMYVYILGQSDGKAFNIPLVIFTDVDLSGAETLEDAAALIRADSKENGKLTVHYQAQLHGSEPASCEGALAMIQRFDGSYGESLLDNMNIYVIPRLNPYGAWKSQRNTKNPNGSTDNVDPNGDFLRLRMVEPQLRQKALNLFDPDVAMDGHEYQVDSGSTSMLDKDIMLAAHFLEKHTEAFQEQSLALANAAFGKLEENGLTYGWYTDVVNNASGDVGSGNAAYRGTLHVLMESHGIFRGRIAYERRVMSQVSVATGILDYLNENTATVKNVVTAQKQAIVDAGKTYEETDQVVLRYEKTSHPELQISGQTVNLGTGNILPRTFGANVWDEIARARTASTAYVLPADLENIDHVLDLMDMQGIAYSYIPAGSAVSLQQYTQVAVNDSGRIIEADLTGEKLTAFPSGAYVFCMNQQNANILALIMEPDVTQDTTNTLVQSDVVAVNDDDTIPIYRYIRDLNSQGTIDYVESPDAPTDLSVTKPTTVDGTGSIEGLKADRLYEYKLDSAEEYTAVTAGSTRITGLPIGKYYVRYQATENTFASADAVCDIDYGNLKEYVVYLDAAAGSDDENGFTESGAVATLEKAYSQLGVIMADAPANTSGKIMFLSTYALPKNRVDFPSHSYPVILTSKTGNEGFSYTNGSDGSKNIVAMNGDTTLENITVTLVKGNTSTYNYLSGMGHKFVIGQNVTSVGTNADVYFNLTGGGYNGTFDSTDLTVMSGTWRQIYIANYASGTINGNAKLKMTGGTVTHYVQPAYQCSITGDLVMDITNADIGSIVCCNTRDWTISGDSLVTVGKDTTVSSITCGGTNAKITGKIYLTIDGADLGGVSITGKKTSATVGGSELILKSGTVDTVTSFDTVTLDTSAGGAVTLGCDMTVGTVKGGGKLTIPAANKLTVSGTVTDSTIVTITGTPTVGTAYIYTAAQQPNNAFVYNGAEYFMAKEEDGQYAWYLTASEGAVATVGGDGFSSLQAAVTASNGNLVILRADADENVVISSDVVLDLNGFDVQSVSVTGNNTLYVMDNKTDDYDVADNDYGRILTVSGQVEGLPESSDLAQDGYLAVTEADGTSFHRVNLQIIGVGLRAENSGMYYQSKFAGDQVVQRNIVAYGIALGANEAPSFRSKTYTAMDADTWTPGSAGNAANGTLLEGVMKKTNTYSVNNRNSNMQIYGVAYVELANGQRMLGKTVHYSLREIFEGTDGIVGADEIFSGLGENQKNAILTFVTTYQTVTRLWNIPNIMKEI